MTIKIKTTTALMY